MNNKQFWVTAILSSLTMATIMSGLISGYKMGFSHEWPPIWLQSFLIAWPCAITLNLTVLPLIRKLSAWICRPRTLCVSEITERWSRANVQELWPKCCHQRSTIKKLCSQINVWITTIKKPSTRLGFLITVVTVKVTAQRCGKPAERHHSRQACLRTSGTSQNLLQLLA